MKQVGRLIRGLHGAWAGPRLLSLPREYERLFSHYHERACLQCGAAPKEASVCLLCGTLVCLKAACCRTAGVSEVSTAALAPCAALALAPAVHCLVFISVECI